MRSNGSMNRMGDGVCTIAIIPTTIAAALEMTCRFGWLTTRLVDFAGNGGEQAKLLSQSAYRERQEVDT
jgi:hypothetical protein